MLKTETRVINGNQWRVTAWPARKSLGIKSRLIRLLGPSLGALFSESRGSIMDMNVEDLGIDKAVSALAQRLDSKEIQTLILDMLSGQCINDTPIDEQFFDSHFSANFEELYRGLGFVLEVNYGSFFQAMRSIMSDTSAQSE